MTEPKNPYAAWEYNFRQQMRRRREAADMTQTDLARRLRDKGLPFHQQTIQRVESGDRPLRLDEAFLIAEALDAPLAAMVRPTDEEVGDLMRSIDRVRREARNIRDDLPELAGDFFEELALLAGQFTDLYLRADESPSPQARYAAAWFIKARWLAQAIEKSTMFAEGLAAEQGRWREDYDRSIYSEVVDSMAWLEDESADAWKQVPEQDRPRYLAEDEPHNLYDYLARQEEGQHVERQEAQATPLSEGR